MYMSFYNTLRTPRILLPSTLAMALILTGCGDKPEATPVETYTGSYDTGGTGVTQAPVGPSVAPPGSVDMSVFTIESIDFNRLSTEDNYAALPIVTALQHALDTIGCGPIDVDGRFGTGTELVVTKYQTNKNYAMPERDGVVGPQTATDLLADYAAVQGGAAATCGI